MEYRRVSRRYSMNVERVPLCEFAEHDVDMGPCAPAVDKECESARGARPYEVGLDPVDVGRVALSIRADGFSRRFPRDGE